jgi:DNA ligase-1
MDFLDLEVVGLEEGTGRNQGKLGAAIVEHKGYKVNVGSGFTDEEREKYWNNPNLLVGKTIGIIL